MYNKWYFDILYNSWYKNDWYNFYSNVLIQAKKCLMFLKPDGLEIGKCWHYIIGII